MMKITDFIENDIKVSWKLLYLGFGGDAKFSGQLTGRDIVSYAISKSEENDCPLDVILLASANERNTEEIRGLLKKLSSDENTDIDIEFRKLRVLYVIQHLPNIDEEYIQGLIKLGDIWAHFDFSSDSPHAFQGLNNTITPEKYYTKENYEKLLQSHRNWIKQEIFELKQGT